ncbi:MAG: pyrroline-5-carboxylate reductase [Pseudomonadales bacterium]|nr:pyrroline-5-carboxylate reductase [Pseudomonadales bacterium]
MNLHIAFIGAGNMASAIIGGLLDSGMAAQQIIAADPFQPQLDKVRTSFGIATTDDNTKAIEHADIVVLAVKPQLMQSLCNEIRDAVAARAPLLISIAAGINCEMFAKWLGSEIALVRCMPNTPALVNAGATGLYANQQVSLQQRQQAEQLLTSIGLTEWVDQETLLDAVTALSGSGPAYFFLLMEAMIAAAENLGLNRQSAEKLCLQTALGAAKMAITADDDVAELRRKVTSPNGTTEAAINSFINDNFDAAVTAALAAADARSKAIAKEMATEQ